MDNTIYTVLLCLYMADPATCLASNSVLGTLSFLAGVLRKNEYFWVPIIIIIIIIIIINNNNVFEFLLQSYTVLL